MSYDKLDVAFLIVFPSLSDDPSITVGVIEAGKNFEDNTILIPGNGAPFTCRACD